MPLYSNRAPTDGEPKERMATMFTRVYSSFEEFERQELRKLDQLYSSVDDMVDELLMAELDDDPPGGDDGILFDRLED